MKNNTAILLLSCHDQKGLIYKITRFIFKHKGNIVQLNEHVDKSDNVFFFRVEWEMEGFEISENDIESTLKKTLFDSYHMYWELYFSNHTPKMALFASQNTHCTYDILSRYFSNEWNVNIPVIFSNRHSHQELATKYGIEFYHFDLEGRTKAEVEQEQLSILQEMNVDFIVLARYMQVLTGNFLKSFNKKIINIHHSFLPAFAGAMPYHRAFERGVKIIGATSHYVTEDLDEGPIIAQSVVDVSHKDSIDDLKRKGRDIEKLVLSKAIHLHLHRRVLTYKNRTIIFD